MNKERLTLKFAGVFILGALLIWPFSSCTFFRGQEAATRFDNTSEREGTVTSQTVRGFISSVRPHQEDVESIFRRARYFQERKKYRLALQEFHAVVRVDPNHSEAYNAMGVCYDFLRDYERAVYCYKKALAINPDLAYVQNNLGYSYLLQGNVEEAIQAFKKAIALDTQQTLYHNNLGLAYAKKGLYQPAFEEFAATGDESKAHQNIAQIYFSKGLSAEALTHLAQAKSSVSPGPSIDPVNPKSTIAASQTRRKSEEETLSGFAFTGSKGIKESGPGIEVANGNGVRFMARDVSRYLAKKGYAVQKLSNARTFSHEKTIIYYKDDCLPYAYRIAKEMPGWNEILKDERSTRPNIKVRLLLGKDLVIFREMFKNVV